MGREGDGSWADEMEEDMDELEECMDVRVRADDSSNDEIHEDGVDNPGRGPGAGRVVGVEERRAVAGEREELKSSLHGGRQANFEVRSGDWVCTGLGCGNWNFSLRKTCNRCYVGHPGSGGDGIGKEGLTKTWAERAKSAFLITVTGGGENMLHLSKEGVVEREVNDCLR